MKPADSFDLIRLIARSQSDPRKAIAELVQNSLDAGATHVRIHWSSHAGRRAISVADDGTGVFPGMDREEALHRLATTIGHSHKAHLTPAQRIHEMTLGKYGIGLLGFWSVGHVMEVRTRVKGSEGRVLRLVEDGREGIVSRWRGGRLLEETGTEVVVTEIHDAAVPALKPRRLAAYLAGEMRGQLLARGTLLEIHDHVARGRAAKRLVVKPQRFQGSPIQDLAELTVPGRASARVEIYLVPEAEARVGRVNLACGGTTILDDLALLDGPDSPDGSDAPREPWASGRFEGVVDYPDFEVAPGSRRGFLPNDASLAFLEALPALETRLRAILAEDASRRRNEREAEDVKDLRRVFRSLPRSLPQYALLDVSDGRTDDPPLADGAEPPAGEPAAPEALAPEVVSDPAPVPPAPAPHLYPPGPPASVAIRPRQSVVPTEGARRLKAVVSDADGREVPYDLAVTALSWSLEGPGVLEAEGDAATYRAPAERGEAVVRVALAVAGAGTGTGAGIDASAEARIRVTDSASPDEGATSGVPDPEPVQAAGESWRSRVIAGVWQYNAGHADYRKVQDDARLRLRYLVHLFAKEIVQRNFASPAEGPLLERMVEVLTHVGDATPRGRPARKPEV